MKTMSDEIQENETPKNETVVEQPNAPAGENPKEESKDLQSALAQKEHFRTKLEKAERELIELRSKPASVPSPTQGIDPLEVVGLGKALSNYDEEETSFIIRNAKDKSPKGIIEASKDVWVSDAITARRAKVAKEKQILGPSSPGSTPTFSQKSPTEIGKMSQKEYDSYLEQLRSYNPSNGIGI